MFTVERALFRAQISRIEEALRKKGREYDAAIQELAEAKATLHDVEQGEPGAGRGARHC